jgi:hypothetical protein
MGKKSRDPRDERNAWRLEEEAAREQMHLQRLERAATDGGRGRGVASSAKRGPQDATDASAQPAGEQGKTKKRKKEAERLGRTLLRGRPARLLGRVGDGRRSGSEVKGEEEKSGATRRRGPAARPENSARRAPHRN